MMRRLINRSANDRRTIYGFLLIMLFAIAAVNVCSHSIASRSEDLLRVSQLEASSYKLVAILNGGLRGESVDELPEVSRRLDILAKSIDSEEDANEVSGLKKQYERFLANATAEYQALQRRDIARATAIDKAETDPAFALIQAELLKLGAERGEETEAWIVRARVLMNVALAVSGLLFGVLLASYRSNTLALNEAEAERKLAEAGERRFMALVRNNSDVISVVDREGTFKLVSEVASKAWGRSPVTLLGQPLYQYVHPEDVATIRTSIREVLEGAVDERAEVRMVDSQGGFRPFQVYLANHEKDPDVGGILLTFHDLMERKRFEAELTHHAFHDRLTGLPNRALFLDRLSHRIQISALSTAAFGVLFIDLDNFKVINDSLGHEAGDELLIEVARRLTTVIRPTDTLARLGGDEFTILVEDASGEQDAISLAERLITTLQSGILLEGRDVYVTASIGIAVSLDTHANAGSVLRDADTAMYQAKGHGKSGFAVFNPSMNERATERLELEADLRQAIDHEEFTLYYQPVVDIDSGAIKHVEALLRWQHPTRGQIAPSKFVPIAEETGLICPLGLWVIRTACQQLVRWDQERPDTPVPGISVNVSRRQFEQLDFVSQVKSVLAETGIEPRRLELEIKETAMLKDLDRLSLIFHELRALGVRISIDDFGSGYWSISYLNRLAVDSLKIDRSFVAALAHDERASGVVRAMIDMARSLQVEITSEGIESTEQLGILQKLGCDYGQGFLFSRPQLGIDGAVAGLEVQQALSETTS